jgi:hypothetical protein
MQDINGKGRNCQCGAITLATFLTGVSVAILALFVLLLPGSVRAQMATADVVGTVIDQTGAVVPGATVIIKNTATGVLHSAQTGKMGEYTFSLLQVGTYEVKVTAKGFKTHIASSISLTPGDRARVDATMEVGAASESISVSAEAAATLHTDSSEISSVVPEVSVQDAPLNGRNLTSLVLMEPGVSEQLSGSRVDGSQMDDKRLSSSYVVNSQPDLTNNNMIDGMDNNDRRLGVEEVKPSVDAIQEVKVSTNLYSAEMGRTGGGVVEVITKSGTNSFHGSAYEYLRNDALDAKDYFWLPSTGKPTLRQNQFGASFGGPVRKNKTFFFTDFEIFRRGSTNVNNQTVPDVVQTDATGGTAHLKDLLSGGGPITLFEQYAPAGAPPGSPQTSTIETLNPGTLETNILALYPSPNGCTVANSTANYCTNLLTTQDAFTYDARIDQHFNDHNTLFGRFSYNQTVTTNNPSLPPETVNGTKFSEGGVTAHQPQLGIALNFTHTFRANLLLDLKAGYTYSANKYAPSDPKGIATTIGFQCDSTFCVNATSLPATENGMPSLSLGYGTGNYAQIGEGMFVPLLVVNNSFQYNGSLTYVRGNQSFKIGLTLMRRQLMGAQSSSMYGSIGFAGGDFGVANGTYSSATQTLCTAESSTPGPPGPTPDCTNLGPFGAFLAGVTSSKSRTALAVTPHYRMYEPSGYIQDDWRVNSKLTLNLGVRYDIFPPYSEINGYVSNFDPAVGLIVSPDLLGAQHASKTANVPTTYDQVAPRFGFAESLGHNMVVRGGFGVTYTPDTAGGPNSSLTNAPFVYSANCGAATGGPGKNGAPSPFHGAAGTPCSDVNGTDYASLASGLKIPSEMQALATDTNNYASETINAISTKLKTTALYQYSLNVEKQWRSNLVSVGYVGYVGRHLTSWIDTNQPVDATAPYPYPQFTLNSAGPDSGTVNTTAVGGTTGVIAPAIMDIVSGGVDNYNGMRATFSRRAAKGVTASLNYQWAHAMGNASLMTEGNGMDPGCSMGCPVDEGNGKIRMEDGYQQYDYGNSGLDVRHRASAIVNYALPFAQNQHGIVGALAKGWKTNLMGSISSGEPFSMSNGGGGPGGGSAWTGLVNYNGSDRPNSTGACKSSHPNINAWINLSCFSLQQEYTWGNERNYQLFGPGNRSLNLSVMKEFQVLESVRLQFRAEGYNIDNHAILGQPQNGLSATNYTYGHYGTTCISAPAPGQSGPPPTDPSNPNCSEEAGMVPGIGTVVRTGGGGPPGGPGGGQSYPGAITSTQGMTANRQLQFALKILF